MAHEGDKRCPAHGKASCPECALISDEWLDDDGTCKGCGYWGATGMHWDTCPGRLRGVIHLGNTKEEALKNAEAYLNSLAADTILNPEDPFESVLIDMVLTNRKKRADYAIDGDPFSNFRFTADLEGNDPEWSAVFNVAQKLARLYTLRKNGRSPQNESVEDTFLDMAVYSVIAYAIYRSRIEKDGNAGSEGS